MRIELHIERLVVEGLGLTSTDRGALGAAVEAELAAALAGAGHSSLAPAADAARRTSVALPHDATAKVINPP